jgi:methylenetetrahydrofolate reductase (NADPH)
MRIYSETKGRCWCEYIVTQMFFDNSRYFRFVEMCRKAGITVPVIPLKPVTSRESDVQCFPKRSILIFLKALVREIEKCPDQAAVRKTGIEWTIQQSKELLSADVPVLHYFTMSKPESIVEIVSKVF